jgi:hypothetical protein
MTFSPRGRILLITIAFRTEILRFTVEIHSRGRIYLLSGLELRFTVKTLLTRYIDTSSSRYRSTYDNPRICGPEYLTRPRTTRLTVI